MTERKHSRATTMRKRREEDGWARVDLYIPPGKALRKLDALTGGDKQKRVEAILDLLERA